MNSMSKYVMVGCLIGVATVSLIHMENQRHEEIYLPSGYECEFPHEPMKNYQIPELGNRIVITATGIDSGFHTVLGASWSFCL